MERGYAALLVKTLVPIPFADVCFYVYQEKDLRTFPGTARGTQDWNDTYKIPVI
jgi:hypothetical protein